MRTAPAVLGLAAAIALTTLTGPAAAHPAFAELDRAMTEERIRHPDDPAVLLRQAQVHRVARRWEAALGTLDQAAADGADADEVEAERGLVLLDAGKARAARRALDRVLDHPPDRPSVRFARGRAWMALGRPDRAARDFGQAIRAFSTPTPDHVLAWRDALLAAGRGEAALAALDEGMARVGAVTSLALAAVELSEMLGHHDDALRRLAALLARHPDNPFWMARRAEILDRAGRPGEARASRTHALRLLDPPRGARHAALAARLRAALPTGPDATEGQP